MNQLAGKVALITGASRGIGAAIAKRFAAEGAKVVCSARSLHPGEDHLSGSLSELVASIEVEGGLAVPIAADISSSDSRAALAAQALGQFGRIDILVNNAATNTYGTLFQDI